MARKTTNTGWTEITFESATGQRVTGRVVQVIPKKPKRSYAVVEYCTSLPGGRQSPPLRECFLIVNGCYLDIIARRNLIGGQAK